MTPAAPSIARGPDVGPDVPESGSLGRARYARTGRSGRTETLLSRSPGERRVGREVRPDTNYKAELTIAATVVRYRPAHKYTITQRPPFGTGGRLGEGWWNRI
jgi:hypothetical protein